MDTLRLSVSGPSPLIPSVEDQGLFEALSLLNCVQQGEDRYRNSLGWHSAGLWSGEHWIRQCDELALEIRSKADAFVVVGVGGSNQAARAAITALRDQTNGPVILWGGNTLAAFETAELLSQLDAYQNVVINVIAKNFETLEPGISFRILRHYLQSRYPEDWQRHVVATCTPGSQFEALCITHGFRFLPFPSDIGGRFTALSPVGLFPMAVAGLDIRELAAGASEMERLLKGDAGPGNPALRYALLRNALYRRGYRMELLTSFEPRMARFAKWWVQLFGESEGKQGLGLYPVSANYSEDLHSIGQFVQDGTPILLESFLTFRGEESRIPCGPDTVQDGFGYLDHRCMAELNRAACAATLAAHGEVLPCIELSWPALSARTLGQLFYFFLFSCYLSGRILGVDPFDQPGVEAYKTRMFQILGK